MNFEIYPCFIRVNQWLKSPRLPRFEIPIHEFIPLKAGPLNHAKKGMRCMKLRMKIMTAISMMMVLIVLKNNSAQESGAVKEAPEPSAPVVTQAVSKADTIVVTATRILQSIRDIGVSVSVVPRERIEELNAQLIKGISGAVNYTLLDAQDTSGACAAQTVVKGVEIFARGDNLLDKQYQLVNGYPMPGLSVMGGVKATF